jgi:ABC-2 type transport system permease protein
MRATRPLGLPGTAGSPRRTPFRKITADRVEGQAKAKGWMMATAAVPTRTARTRAVPAAARRPGLTETLRSELTKIASVRSTYWTLLAQAAASIGWAVLDCAGTVSHWSHQPAQDHAGFNAAAVSLTGQVALGELIIVVLGALVLTSEYSTGMIRTSMTVMPRRGVLYAAKAMVLAAVTFTISLAASFTAFFTGQAILASKHINTTLAQPGVLRAVLLSAAVVTVFGLLAYGTGAIIRHTAGAITAILGVIFLTPLLTQALPTPWYQDIARWLPGGQALSPIFSSAPAPGPDLFSAWGEFGVFCGYAVVLLAAGAWLFSRRDA